MAQPVVSPEPRRTPLAPADVIDYLLERGALVAADLVHADFYVEVIERRNRTYVVHGTSPLVVVKTSRDLFDQGVEHEAATYRALQDGPEGLGACVPRVLSYDEERRALVLEYVRDAQSLHDYHLRSGRAPAYVGRAVGRLLGELHNAWSSSPAVTQPPWALSLAAPPMMIFADGEQWHDTGAPTSTGNVRGHGSAGGHATRVEIQYCQSWGCPPGQSTVSFLRSFHPTSAGLARLGAFRRG